MKKIYEKPFAESMMISSLCHILEASELSAGDAMGKENNSVWEDVDDEDDLLEPVEPKDVWGDDEPSEP